MPISASRSCRHCCAEDIGGLSSFADKKLYPTIDPLGTEISRLIDLQIRVAKENLEAGQHSQGHVDHVDGCHVRYVAGVAIFSTWTVIAGVIRRSIP